MKNLRTRLILAITCAFFFAQGIAMSEDTPTMPPLRHILRLSASVTPDQLVEAGTATLTVEAENTSEYDAENLRVQIEGEQHAVTLGRLAAGESSRFRTDVAVTDGMLEEGVLRLTVLHDGIAGSSSPADYPLEAAVTRCEPFSDVEFTRSLSSDAVGSGGVVLVTYGVKNTGNVALTQLRLQDSLGDFTAQADELQPGETKRFSQRVTVDKDTFSAPSIRYVAPALGDKTREASLERSGIRVLEPKLEAFLTLDRQTAANGDLLSGVITVTASGSDFTDVYVVDTDYGTLLSDSMEVKNGESLTLSCAWPVRGPSEYQVTASGTAETGEVYSAQSNRSGVSLSGEFSFCDLSVSAYAQTPSINRAGKAQVVVEISNSGNVSARNVRLYEETLGEIRTFDFVPAGEITRRTVLVDVEEDRKLTFCADYESEAGVPETATAEPVTIRIESGGADPIVTEQEDNSFADWVMHRLGGQTEYIWLLSAAGGILAVLIVLLVVSHRRDKRNRRQRKRQDSHRRRAPTGAVKTEKRGGNDV